MMKEPKPSTEQPSGADALSEKEELKRQAEQARRVLMRLQWLVIILLASGIVWLYVSFQAVTVKVDERLVKIDNLDNRLNNMDDRIFAITPTQDEQKARKTTDSQGAELIKVELALVQQLFERGNYTETLTALESIEYQLGQMDGISLAMKSALSGSLKADIAYVNALKNQPDAWQAHALKMRELQAFLRRQQANRPANDPLTHSDVMLHDVGMMLSLAIGSANVRDRDTMTGYLQEAKTQLEQHIVLNGGSIEIKRPTTKADGSTHETPLVTMNDGLYWLYELLANTPKDKGLTSVQMLK